MLTGNSMNRIRRHRMQQIVKASELRQKIDVIKTLRMVMRPAMDEHVDSLHALLAQPGVRKFLCDDRVFTRQDVVEVRTTSAQMYEQAGTGLWIMFDRNIPDNVIGIVGFLPFHEPPVSELVFALDDQCCGHGLAVEACRAMLRYVRDELRWTVAQASTDHANHASARTLYRLGFREAYTMPAPRSKLGIYRKVL
jgi:[ribosomal protein S5]-alanine N-acetyltransferase